MKPSDYKYSSEFKAEQNKEDSLQKVVANFLDYNQEAWFHPPNGGHRNKIVAAKLKGQGVKRGVPDVIIVGLKLVVELKVKSNKPSKEQLQWLQHYRDIGWQAYWVNSFSEFLVLYQNTKRNGRNSEERRSLDDQVLRP